MDACVIFKLFSFIEVCDLALFFKLQLFCTMQWVVLLQSKKCISISSLRNLDVVEPLSVDSPYSGYDAKNLHIKDKLEESKQSHRSDIFQPLKCGNLSNQDICTWYIPTVLD